MINTTMAHLTVQLSDEDKALFRKACQTKGMSMSDRVKEFVKAEIENASSMEKALQVLQELSADEILKAAKNLTLQPLASSPHHPADRT